MNRSKRFIGVDLCRGLAVFAVILVHSGDRTWNVPVDDFAASFRMGFYFAVPFFLAASFYFMLRKENDDAFSNAALLARIRRILSPYFVWTLIYIITRSLFFYFAGKTDRFHAYLSDPFNLIFLGGSSYQMYFLPLLLIGTIALFYLQRRRPLTLINSILFVLVSFVASYLLEITDNQFQLGPNIAFEGLFETLNLNWEDFSPVRVLAVYSAMLITCLPYISLVILYLKVAKKSHSGMLNSWFVFVASLLLFLFVNFFGSSFIPQVFVGPIQGFALLTLGISFPVKFVSNSWIRSLGQASFGIFLVHPILMNVIKILLGKAYPALLESVTLQSILTLSLSTFVLSWIVVCGLLKNSLASKLLFGTGLNLSRNTPKSSLTTTSHQNVR